MRCAESGGEAGGTGRVGDTRVVEMRVGLMLWVMEVVWVVWVRVEIGGDAGVWVMWVMQVMRELCVCVESGGDAGWLIIGEYLCDMYLDIMQI